jgi:hypothetical protein
MPYFLTWKIFYTVFIFLLTLSFLFLKKLYDGLIYCIYQKLECIAGIFQYHKSLAGIFQNHKLLAIVISMLSSSCLALTQFPKVLTVKYTYLFHLGHVGSLIYLFCSNLWNMCYSHACLANGD